MLASVWQGLYDCGPLLFTVSICYVIASYIIDVIRQHGKKHLPGPWGVPFLGYLPFFTDAPYAKFYQLSKKYGEVFGINVLGTRHMVLNSYDSIKELYVTRGLEFTGVPQKFSLLHWLTDSKAMFVTEGEEWLEQKRFVLQALRELGMGKNSMADKIQDISQDLVEELRSQNGSSFDPYNMLSICALNVICSLLFNKHYKKDDHEFKDIISNTAKFFTTFSTNEAFLGQGKLFYFTSMYRKLRPTKDIFINLIRKFIQHHRENLDELNPQDYLDKCLLKMAQSARNEKEKSRFHTEQYVIGNAVGMFLAGTEDVTSTTYWFMLFMIVYPDIQKNVQRELDHFIGRERMPAWSDRASLPYTEAVLCEMQRVGSAVGMGLVHSNAKETEFRGYSIPQRTHVMANIWAANRDPKYWCRPEEFDPTRFLDVNGKFVTKEAMIPFFIGKRSCAGESLARMEMFLFFTCVLQQFNICPPVGVTPSLVPCSGPIRRPLPYKVRAIPRS